MDLEKMKAMLDSYKVLLEQEKQAALKQHFIDFMAQLGITEADKLNQLEKSFFELIDILDFDDSLQSRLQGMARSTFIWDVLQHKTSAKERELRRLTDDICNFIAGASQGAENEQQFLQNLLANSLRQVAESVESGELKSSNVPVMTWVDSLKMGLDSIIKQKI
jgi:hypothetical protein|tara:strand:+ start:4956 stop:5447 length:492 start_codon:yes stop_codon:yes gene_type:complete